MANQDNNRTQKQDMRREPQQQEQAGGKSANKKDKDLQGQQGQAGRQPQQSNRDSMSRH